MMLIAKDRASLNVFKKNMVEIKQKSEPNWMRTSDPTYIGSVPVRLVFYLIPGAAVNLAAWGFSPTDIRF